MKTKQIFLRFVFIMAGFTQILAAGAPDVPDTRNNNDRSKIILDDFRKILAVDKEYKVTCQMATFTPDQKLIVKKYTLYSKNDKTLMITLQPERDAGKKILMIKDNLWQYFPKIQKTMVINAAMNLGGSVNLTDIVSSSLFSLYNYSNYAFDSKNKIHTLTFQAASKNSPYGLVKYYYADGKIMNFEAYARSGILLKKIVFVKYETDELNQIYPSQIKIINALQENDYSLIQMSSLQPMQVPDYYFNPSALDKAGE